MTEVDLTNFFSWTFLLHLVRALVTFNISNAILKSKRNVYVTFFSIVIPCLIYSWIGVSVATLENELLIMVGYYILTFIVLCFAVEGTIFAKLFTAIFSHIAYLIAGYSGSLIAKIVYKSNLSLGVQMTVTVNELVTICVCIFSFSFIFVAFINFIKSKTNPSFMYKTKYTFYYLFPITHIFSSMLIFQAIKIATPEGFAQLMEKDPYFESWIIILMVLCLVFDVCIIFIVDRQSKTEERNIRNEKELLKSELDYNQMQLLKKEQVEFRKVKHDLINLLTTASGFIEMGKTEKALEILRKTGNSFSEISGTPICSNDTLNTICYIKQQMAEKMNVTLKIDIMENAFLKIEDYDLCRLLHNIIDNAINASSKLMSNRTVEISIEISPDFFCVKSKNEYSQQKKTKSTDGVHGNGINIINDIAKKYSGTYTAALEDNFYTTCTYLKNISPVT